MADKIGSVNLTPADRCRIILTKTEASTTRSPSTPLTLRSGSTTPKSAPLGDMLAVATMCPLGAEFARAKASSSASVVALARTPRAPSTYPCHAGADKNFCAVLIPSRMAKMSKSVVRHARSISGWSKGLLVLSLMEPPLEEGQFKVRIGRRDVRTRSRRDERASGADEMSCGRWGYISVLWSTLP